LRIATAGLPAEGLALLIGIDRFMSLARAITNTIGNAVAAVVVATWDGDFDRKARAEASASQLHSRINGHQLARPARHSHRVR
jgi:aerobic C4-dicarboxylate transport protein